MTLANRIRQLGCETIVYGISGIINRFIGIFLIPLYTRFFSPADYGVIAIVSAFTELSAILIILGLDSASARWFYDTNTTIQRQQVISSRFWFQLSLGTFVSLMICILAPHICQFLLDSNQYALVIRLAVLTIPLGTINGILNSWIRYQRRAWMSAIYNTASSLSNIAIIIFFVAVCHWGLIGLYTARLIAAAAIALVAAVILKTWISPRHVSKRLLKEMLTFGIPLAPAGIATWVTMFSDRLILKMFVDTSEVGLYAISGALASGVAIVTGAFQLSWGPFAYSILHEPGSSNVYSKVLSLYSWIVCFLSIAISIFAPHLLYLFTTPLYYKSASSVPYLAFSYMLLGSVYIASLGSGISKKSISTASSIFIGAFINILLNFLLIPHQGRDGAAIATLLAYLCSAVYLFYASQKNHYIPYRFKDPLFCFGFSWFLIGISHFFIPVWGRSAFCMRISICLIFVPLLFYLDIIKLRHTKFLFTLTHQYFRKVSAQ